MASRTVEKRSGFAFSEAFTSSFINAESKDPGPAAACSSNCNFFRELRADRRSDSEK